MDYHELYETHAELYHDLVSAEDYQENLKTTLENLIGSKQNTVLEMGVGTGRVTKLLAPWCEQLLAYDLHQSMLDKIDVKALEPCKVELQVADHLNLPSFKSRFDVVVAGWTLCHIIDDFPKLWRSKIDDIVVKISQSKSPNCKLMIIETLGTGFSTEHAPLHLVDYYLYLEEKGFKKQVIRTDYKFDTIKQANSLIPFFFGKEMLSKLEGSGPYILPECTGVWFKQT